MPTQLEYMQLATRVYAASDYNKIDLPAGWSEVDWLPDQGSGFSAGVYKNAATNEIVIAYAGTNESMDYLSYVAAAGLPAVQVFAAMSYYLTFRDAYPSYNISFTGHSLGGGLASLMAVFFDKQTTVFDEMPTQLSALDPMVYTTALLSMTAAGYYDENFDSYVQSAGSLALTRESNVTQYYINGEFLNTLRISANTLVGSDNPLPMGNSNASIWEKHSMALMLAWWASPAFRTAVQTLPNLVTQLSDENLFAAGKMDSKEDFLLKLIRHQFGTSDGIVPDAMLTRFGEDMQKIAQSGGLTMSNENLTKALTVFAMQMYYENPDAANPERYMVLFDEFGVTGGIHFKSTDVTASIATAQGYKYFDAYLNTLPSTGEITPDALNSVKEKLPNLLDWYIQAGASPMNATAGSNPAFMLGSAGNDTLTGGSANDVLMGGQGIDHLNGGGGNDLLIGGSDGDIIEGGSGNNTLYGGYGNDYLFGGINNDIIYGGDNNDNIKGGNGSNQLFGDDGNDFIVGGNGSDYIDGGTGDDVMHAGGGVNSLRDEDGFDQYYLLKSGRDAINDGGGKGSVYIDGGNLGGGWKIGEYEYTDGSNTYIWSGKEGTTLIINRSKTISNFHNAKRDLGIYLYKKKDGGGGSGGSPGFGGAGAIRVSCDPLLIDLNGDGIKTISSTAGTYFDYDGNGFAERMGWASSDDGVLVLDLNNDGIINDGSELFGDQTILKTGKKAANGFQALADLDKNADGKIDINDTAYSNLRIWRDINGDGYSQGGELFTLQELGISSINLNSTASNVTDAQGNTQTAVGSYGKTDGTTGQIANYNLHRDPAYTIPAEWVDVPEDIAALPDLQAYGNVYNLQQAMAMDTTGELKALVEQFIAEEDPTIRKIIMEQILFHWTDSEGITANRGGMNGRQLATLEKFVGENFKGQFGPKPNALAQVILEQSYQNLLETNYCRLMVQTHLQDLYDKITYTWDEANGTTKADLSAVITELQTRLTSDPVQGKQDLGEFARSLRGVGIPGISEYLSFRETFVSMDATLGWVIDSANGNRVSDAVYGTAGDEKLANGNQYAAIVALGGNDVIYAGAGSDILDGGSGNDTLYGEAGNDSYVFRRGEGQDTIVDSDSTAGNIDTIWFGNNITPEDIAVTRTGDNLIFRLKDTADAIIVKGYYQRYSSAYRIERIQFSDGTTWNEEGIEQQRLIAQATGGDDVIYGTEQNDVLSGLQGSDIMYGYGGNDSLFGNDDNDMLYGDIGNDNLDGGTGNDKLYGEAGNDILLGGAGNDILQGGIGNDTLHGGAGNDTLYGGIDLSYYWNGYMINDANGNDTYLFGRGSGQDTVIDKDKTPDNLDTILLNSDITPADVTLKRNGDNLVLSINDTGESITVSNWFLNESVEYQIEQIKFADGTIWDASAIKQITLQSTSGNDVLIGYSTADNIQGVAGNDQIYGRAGDDTIEGGVGNDELYGEAGNDILLGGEGNDYISGGAGADVLDGGGGSDTLYGGSYDDYWLSNGNDTYLFGRGSGQDTIIDRDATPGNLDTITLSPDVLPDDIIVRRNYDSLVLTIKGTSDKLTIDRWFDESGAYQVEQIRFANGVIWDAAAIKQILIQATSGDDMLIGYSTADNIQGLVGNDKLYGRAGDDTLDGGAGNDQLYGETGNDILLGGEGYDELFGGTGNDTLDGGAGDDILYGGGIFDYIYYMSNYSNGNDTYLFGRGSGYDYIFDYDATPGNLDTILFNSDVKPDDIALSRGGDDLVLSIKDTGEPITVSKWFFNESSEYQVEQIKFADGTIWDVPMISQMLYKGTAGDDVIIGYSTADNLRGMEGNDYLYGGAGNDTLDGGAGNDYLYGGAGDDTLDGGAGDDVLYGGFDDYWHNSANGNDTYLFGRGSGQDTIIDRDTTPGKLDTILLNSDITPADVTLKRNGDNLVLSINDTGESITVSNWFLNESGEYQVEQIKFVDGTIWDVPSIKQMMLQGTSGDDVLIGYSTADIIDGREGNDQIYGRAGDDTIDGGAGDDQLFGETGNDAYLFGRGSGYDTIIDCDTTPGNLDTILLDSDIIPADVTLRRNSDDLVLSVNDTGDTITVSNWFLNESSEYQVEQIKFADGTIWDVPAIKQIALQGTSGDDVLIGYSTADIIDGGAGNDTLIGKAGNDTYVFGRGYGQDQIIDIDNTPGNIDTIQLMPDVSPEDITLTWDFGGLYLTINDTSDSLLLTNWFVNDKDKIEQIQFADGTLWDTVTMENISGLPSYIENQLTGTPDNDVLIGGSTSDFIQGLDGHDYLIGGAGDDIILGDGGYDALYGGDGNDILDGGGGINYLYGGAGNDTYMVGYGAMDYIIDSDTTPGNLDIISLSPYFTPDDIELERRNNDLLLRMNDWHTEQSYIICKVDNWFINEYQVEQIKFADGTIWDAAAINQIILNSGGGVSGSGEDGNILNGGAGDEVLYGGEDNDTIDGGEGNDTLYGGAGNDIYIFGRGYGQDEISDDGNIPGNVDTIKLQDDILPSDVTLKRGGEDFVPNGDLVLSIAGTTDTLTINNWFDYDWDSSSGIGRVEQIQFADGTIWDAAMIENMLNSPTQGDDYLVGTLVNDIIDGGAGDDILYGGAGNYWWSGNDTLYGGAGNDTLIGDCDVLNGGPGDDYLYGHNGNNTFVMNRGGGFDHIMTQFTGWGGDSVVFGAGITPDELSVQISSCSGNALLAIGIGNNEGMLISGTWPLSFNFADGQVLSLDQILALADNGVIGEQHGADGDDSLLGSVANDTIYGGAGADRIDGRDNEDYLHGDDGNDVINAGSGQDIMQGGYGDDIIAGGKGDDQLYDEAGNDVYCFNRGDGKDYICDSSGRLSGEYDSISFGMTINPQDIMAYVNPDDGCLVLTIQGSEDSIAINWFDPISHEEHADGGIDRVQFISADGSARIFDLEGIVQMLSNDLLAATAESPISLFTDATSSFELTGNVDPAGGDYTVAYAQTGDLFAVPSYYTGGSDDDIIYGDSGVDIINAGDGSNIVNAGDGNNEVYAGTGDDQITTGNGNDYIDAGSGNNGIYAGAGNDEIYSGPGSDFIDAGDGNDSLKGGGGDDYLMGGAGDDTYYFNIGDGSMWIDDLADASGGNRIVFGMGITPDDISLNAGDGVLNINVGGNGDQIYLMNFNTDDAYGPHAVEYYEFADGQVLTYSQLIDKGFDFTGTLGEDALIGTNTKDRIEGFGGDDIIVGGQGNDILNGGSGNDTYVFNLGDGVDTIQDMSFSGAGNVVQFGEGISVSDLKVSADQNTFVIQIGEGGDELRFDGFNPDDVYGNHAVGTIRFADGLVISYSELIDLGFTFAGTAGNDTFTGTNGRDTFIGVSGNDNLAGGVGDDIYMFNPGDDVDKINDESSPDQPNAIVFGEGITLADIKLNHDPINRELIINIDGNGDSVHLKNFDAADPYGPHAVEYFMFADGQTITYSQLIDCGFDIIGTADDDTFSGTAAVDRISGGIGNDTLTSGSGNDTMAGGEGDDTYIFNMGDGVDVIDDVATASAGNTLVFGEGITLADMRNSLSFEDGTFIIRIGNNGDEVHLKGFDPDGAETCSHAVETFLFADGTIINYADLIQNTFVVQGNSEDNHITGTNMTDRLYGYYGFDTLEGGAGDDVLTGGLGDDELIGGAGNDTYVFNIGDGVDTIQDVATEIEGNRILFGAGITQNDLTFNQTGNVLTINVGNNGDAIRLLNYDFNGVSGSQVVKILEFADGSQTLLADFLYPELGTEGDDIINTGPEDDVINAKGGDDIVNSDGGNDLVDGGSGYNIINSGDGNDTLIGGSDVDILNGGVGADSMMGGFGNDTYIVDNVDDVVIENAYEGRDTVQSSISYTLGTNIEYLTLTGNEAINGTGNELNNVIIGNGSANIIEGKAGSDSMIGNAGDDIYIVDDTGDVVIENINEGRDTVQSSISYTLGDNVENLTLTGNEAINGTGNELNNVIIGNANANVFTGGLGDDDLVGNVGNDTYVFNIGNGVDTITDTSTIAEGNIISFGEGITSSELLFVKNGSTLTINVGNYGDAINLLNFDQNEITGSFVVRTLQFADGSQVNLADLLNRPPFVANPIADQSTLEDEPFSFTVPADTFKDVDAGDSLTYSATLADGSALPSWLTFDAATMNFSGTPTNDNVDTLSLKVTATDIANASVSDDFDVTVVNVNDAPFVVKSIENQSTLEDAAFSFTVPADTFKDIDAGDSLTYSATLADGSALPSWLTFDAATMTFSGTPDNDNVDTLSLKVTATDIAGASVSDDFDVTVVNVNDAPVVINPIINQIATEDAAFTFMIPANTFKDIDVGDTLTYSATLANGDNLPGWLHFDANTQTFSGTPENADVKTLSIHVTATDTSNASVSTEFDITVNNVNDAPFVVKSIENQSTLEDAAFSFTVPADTFKDIDVGDVLIYSATLADGSALPPWLTFDAATMTFSGTPTNDNVDTLSLKVTATDIAGASAFDDFDVTVVNVNDPPFVVKSTENQSTLEDAAFSFTVPDDTFKDIDAGDILTYSATLADGSALPPWLTFDAATMTFSVTPTNDNVDTLSLKVTATDIAGASVSDDFDVTVVNVNDPPVVVTSLMNQSAIEDVAFNFTVPSNTFSDVDAGDVLTYSATLADGSALPSWLIFDAATMTFSGTPDNDNVDTLSLKVTATDIAGASVSDDFDVEVINVNDAPFVAKLIADQSTLEDAAFSFTVPADTFKDIDAGDILTYSASLSDGSALPAWLTFDAAMMTFSGTPTNDNVDTLSLKVTATDIAGASAFDDFNLTVINVNDAPVVVKPLADQTIKKCTSFRYVVPTDTFKDIDVGDTLTYRATLADGSALPCWLKFDAATMTFSGTPTCTGKISVKVTATDMAGAGVSDTFDLDIRKVTYGTNCCDLIITCCDNDIIYALNGIDKVYAGAGDDIIYGGNCNDYLYGECGNDLIYGENDNDYLSGGSGNDTLDGGTGADTMIGGCGNDTYVVDKLSSGFCNPGDVVTENCNEGIDTVQSSVTYTLGNNVENLTLTGTSAINGTGNNLNNILIGNGAVNTLTGGAGNDTLDGGLGNDILTGGNGSDTYLFGNLDGKDRINETAGACGDTDTLKLSGASTDDPVIVKQGNDLYVFIDANNYMKIASEFQQTNYGVERLEVSDGHYITRSDIQTIVDTMSTINNNSGMDVMQKYTAMMDNQQYHNILTSSWHQV